MSSVEGMFSDLKKKTKSRFPDLIEIIEKKQKQTQKHSTELLCNMLKSIFQKMTEDL